MKISSALLMIYFKSLLLCLILLFLQHHTFGQKFKKIEKEIKEGDDMPNAYEQPNKGNDKSTANALSEIIGTILFNFPKESDLQQIYGQPIKLSKYTYSGGEDARYTRIKEQQKTLSWDLQANYFFENKNVQGIQVFTRFQFMPKLSIDVDYSGLREKTENEGNFYLDFFHANLSYHRLAFTRFDLWVGTGFTSIWIGENYTGWNFNLGSEIYIVKPVSLFTNWYFGGIEEINFTQGSSDLKVYINRLQVFAGYQYYKLGSVRIHGPRGGIGFSL
ncbi:hypothetical protein [Flammeovirga sp. SJP92]|uniref:hypothetical protein n=1 Tax=Flammeovirga sp. SJP92 TaxID=1775430 RepID=UPI000796BBE9|nr:hypothetical protein [Flammeovirga sp. SJP92]KXX69207.1 hypothetical protein AVL50_20230 [Flammeovirga sp. SJP92]